MSEHAPAPWKIEPYVDAIDILDADGNAVAHLADRRIDHVGMPPDNARLIAAAPALLEACELTQFWDRRALLASNSEFNSFLDRIRALGWDGTSILDFLFSLRGAAIAAAKGEPNGIHG